MNNYRLKRRGVYGLLWILLWSVNIAFASDVQTGIQVKGQVLCNGTGIDNVAVTDGVSVVLTKNGGHYSFRVAEDRPFVYLSSPAGYTVPVLNSVPLFFARIEKNKTNHIDFQLEKLPYDDTHHGFIAWADPQVKTGEEAMLAKSVANDLSALLTKEYKNVPFHGLGCGDIVADNPALFDTMKNVLASVGIPFYQSIGNHDMHYNGRSDKGSEDVFETHFGPAYYSFNRGKVHYVVLDDVFYIGRDYFYIGYLSEEQLAWLEKDLSVVAEGSTVVVALHIPTALDEADLKVFSYGNISKSVTNKKALYKILAPYQAHIISGHMHQTHNVVIAPNLLEHNVSSVCGAWWQGPYAEDGTPNGYGVFEVNGSDLKWFFKSSGYDRDYQFRAYPVGMNKEQPEYLTVNVWNWDPEWKVYWYEDGTQMGEMEAYVGTDPGTIAAYADKEKLDYKWLSASKTTHLFRAKPEKADARISVEVVDRFGNRYIQKIDRLRK